MEDSSEGDGNTCKDTNAYTKIITENIIINEYVELFKRYCNLRI